MRRSRVLLVVVAILVLVTSVGSCSLFSRGFEAQLTIETLE